MIDADYGKTSEAILSHGRPQVGLDELQLWEAPLRWGRSQRKSAGDSQGKPHIRIRFIQMFFVDEGQKL